jgi:DNA polymerase elongation subunit (family B)
MVNDDCSNNTNHNISNYASSFIVADTQIDEDTNNIHIKPSRIVEQDPSALFLEIDSHLTQSRVSVAAAHNKNTNAYLMTQSRTQTQTQTHSQSQAASESETGKTGQHSKQNLTVMSIEILCKNRRNLLPNPKCYCIFAIAIIIANDDQIINQTILLYFGNKVYHQRLVNARNKCIGLKILASKIDSQVELLSFASEIALFNAFIRAVRIWDPDIIVIYTHDTDIYVYGK